MNRKTTHKEIIEEFDANGKLKSRTTIEETEEEGEDVRFEPIKNPYCDLFRCATTTYVNPINCNTELEGQVGIHEYVVGKTHNEYQSFGR